MAVTVACVHTSMHAGTSTAPHRTAEEYKYHLEITRACMDRNHIASVHATTANTIETRTLCSIACSTTHLPTINSIISQHIISYKTRHTTYIHHTNKQHTPYIIYSTNTWTNTNTNTSYTNEINELSIDQILQSSSRASSCTVPRNTTVHSHEWMERIGTEHAFLKTVT